MTKMTSEKWKLIENDNEKMKVIINGAWFVKASKYKRNEEIIEGDQSKYQCVIWRWK